MSQITVIGFLSDDPDLRYATSGEPLCHFRVGENTAKRGEEARWTNYRCTAFGELAENIGASLAKSDRVVVVGRMEEREYVNSQGETKRSMQLVVHDCGPALRFAAVEVTRTPKKGDR